MIDLLITDNTNPRSLVFLLQTINQLIAELPNDSIDQASGEDQRSAEDLLHCIRMAQPTELAFTGTTGQRHELCELLNKLINGLPRLSNEITARYLIHTGSTQLLNGSTSPVSDKR